MFWPWACLRDEELELIKTIFNANRMSGKASRMFYRKTERPVSIMSSSCSPARCVFGTSSQSDHVTELSLLKQSVSRPANLIPGQ